jgi:hypothetical protein
MVIDYCGVCGDFTFDGVHRGNVARWCREGRETIIREPDPRETIIPGAIIEIGRETIIPDETKNQKVLENIDLEFSSHRKRGRPRRQGIVPWTAAGMSRATWYRKMKSGSDGR